MATHINADEVFGIGVEIEKNGRSFYLAAAEATADPGAKALFQRLSNWELGHVRLFENLRRKLPPQAKTETVYDPNDEMALYLKAAADNHVFVRTLDAGGLARACKTPIEALNLAMNFEKDSVVYYSAVRKAVSEAQGRGEIERIIDEELSHIAYLDKQLRDLSRP